VGGAHLPGRELARARDLGHVRHHLRRSPLADPHPHARRLARPPPAEGLPARWHPGRVQGRHHPAAGPAEVVQLMSTHDTEAEFGAAGHGASSAEDTYVYGEDQDTFEHEGNVFTAQGGDWDDLVDEATSLNEERIVVNMGP